MCFLLYLHKYTTKLVLGFVASDRAVSGITCTVVNETEFTIVSIWFKNQRVIAHNVTFTLWSHYAHHTTATSAAEVMCLLWRSEVQIVLEKVLLEKHLAAVLCEIT